MPDLGIVEGAVALGTGITDFLGTLLGGGEAAAGATEGAIAGVGGGVAEAAPLATGANVLGAVDTALGAPGAGLVGTPLQGADAALSAPMGLGGPPVSAAAGGWAPAVTTPTDVGWLGDVGTGSWAPTAASTATDFDASAATDMGGVMRNLSNPVAEGVLTGEPSMGGGAAAAADTAKAGGLESLGGGATEPTVPPSTTAVGNNEAIPGSGGSWADSALKYGRFLGPAAGLASVGVSALRGNKLPWQAGQLEAIGGKEKDVGGQFLTAAQHDQITPEMQAAVDQYVQQAQTQLYQQYAQGGGDPTKNTAYLSQLAQIQQNAAILHEKFVKQIFDEAMASLGGASSDFQYVAKMKYDQDQALAAALGNAARAFGGAYGGYKQ